MTDDAYAFATARVRYREASLLDRPFLDGMINAPGVDEALQSLAARGWELPEGCDWRAALKKRTADVWDEIRELAGDQRLLDFMTAKNDAYNVKAALKAIVSSTSPEGLLVTPAGLDPASLPELLAKKEYSKLPEIFADAAKEAYGLLTDAFDPQKADAVLDKAALRRQLEIARELKDGFLEDLAVTDARLTDLRVAKRFAGTKRSGEALRDFVTGEGGISSADLAAASGSDEELSARLAELGFDAESEAVKNDDVKFEKYCDDALIAIVRRNIYEAMGARIVVGYWLAARTEIRAVGIVLQCKELGMDDQAAERIRDLYV